MSIGPASSLALTNDHLAVLRAAAAAAYPNEFCALLFGIDQTDRDGAENSSRVTRIVFADNVDPHPERGFELDPKVLIRELRALREVERAGQGDGERLLGHVHSHPDAAPVPSERDLGQAWEPGQFWLIVPVERGQAGSPSAFQAAANVTGQTLFQPVRLTISG
jgi:proteasome lid subunit RPN8/RPN11